MTATLAGCASHSTGSASRASAPDRAIPATGKELLERMHARYDGTWFQTLTFSQQTTLRRPDGTEVVQTWLEAMKAPTFLRIDIMPLSNGNGIIFTADSTYRVRNGQLAQATADRNPLIPFVGSLYLQPVERTLREIETEHYDMSRVRSDTWEGTPVIVVGASDASDLASPQFWVDATTLVTRRVILKSRDGKPEDIRLDAYKPSGGGWVATDVRVIVEGVTVQHEVYSDVRTNVPLSSDLFDPAKWSTTPHWSK